VKIPLCEDADVLSWLMHSDDDIVDQMIQGLVVPDVVKLAAWLRSEAGGSDHWKAAQLFYILAMQVSSSTVEEKVLHLDHCIAATDNCVAEGTQPGNLDLAFMARQILLRHSGKPQCHHREYNIHHIPSAHVATTLTAKVAFFPPILFQIERARKIRALSGAWH
jgi:hypothetical protein